MEPGAVIAARYAVQELAGAGGMGAVFRARDEERGGQWVAIKLLQSHLSQLGHRFDREAQVLRALDHPGIVRCLDSGETAGGEQFLVMEWLDGRDLKAALGAGRLAVVDALTAIARIADALAYAHEAGVVHRDVKPSNIFLPGGEAAAAKLLDFGIARFGGQRLEPVAADGERAGTPAYMAPEQVRGGRRVGPAADVFGLGCVLFECLTGEPAFVSRDPMAVFCKILMDDPPRASDVVASVPEPLDALLQRMLAQRAGDRPDAAAVAAALRDMAEAPTAAGEAPGETADSARPESARITAAEQRLVHVVMAVIEARPFDPDDEPTLWVTGRGDDAPSARGGAGRSGARTSRLIDPAALASRARVSGSRTRAGQTTDPGRRRRHEPLTSELSAFHHLDPGMLIQVEALAAQLHAVGGRFSVLGDGSMIAVFQTAVSRVARYQSAVDQATNAARCALGLHRVFPHASVALATGRAVVRGQRLVGEIIDVAAALLGPSRARAAATGVGEIRLDSLTAGLLGSRFDVAGDAGSGLTLQAERRIVATQTLLGKATPFVGREREFGAAAAALDAAIASSSARVVTVMAPPGFGKSRLCEELIGALEDGDAEVEIWLARGDPMRGGAPLAMMADAIRNAAGIADGEPAALRRRKLAARVARSVPLADRDRVAAFLAELLSIPAGRARSGRRPSRETPSQVAVAIQLAAARRDPKLMGDQMRRACRDLLDAETRQGPVLLALEDFHWADRATARLLARCVRDAADRPLLVLALARPEGEGHASWPADRVTSIELGPLPEDACRQLASAILSDAEPARLSAVIASADGNPLYLEELVRGAAAGAPGVPETVGALMHARLGALESPARQILRAASVFGRVFWRGGVIALVGDDVPIDDWLAEMVAAELIALAPSSRFPRDAEYQFRHAITRDVAYEMLTEDDRRLGHRLAGRWLERVGESDALVIAEHLSAAGASADALPFYLRAAQEALARTDFDAAVALGRRAQECGAAGADLGAIEQIRAENQIWRGNTARVAEHGETAMTLLPEGGRAWYGVAAETGIAWGKLGEAGRTEALAERIRGAAGRAADDAGDPVGRDVALVKLSQQLLLSGRIALADAILAEIAAGWEDGVPPILIPDLHLARALRASLAEDGDPTAVLSELEACADGFEAIGDSRQTCLHRSNVGFAQMELGLYFEAEAQLRAALEVAESMGLDAVAHGARRTLTQVLAYRGHYAEALDMGARAAAWFAAQDDHRLTAMTQVALATAAATAGERQVAAAAADAALAVLAEDAPLRPLALSTRARIHLDAGEVDAALTLAERAAALLDAGEAVEGGTTAVYTILAEALVAAGERDRARRVISRARDSLRSRAAQIRRDDWRERFLRDVPMHARAMALADELALADTPG